MAQSVCVYVLSDRLQLWIHIIIIIISDIYLDGNYYFLHIKCVLNIIEMYI